MRVHKIRLEFIALALVVSACTQVPSDSQSGYVANPDGNNDGATLYCSTNGGTYTGPPSSTLAEGGSFSWNFDGSGGAVIQTSPEGINPPTSTYNIMSDTVGGSIGEFPDPSSLSVSPHSPQDILNNVVIPPQIRDQIISYFIRYEEKCANTFGWTSYVGHEPLAPLARMKKDSLATSLAWAISKPAGSHFSI